MTGHSRNYESREQQLDAEIKQKLEKESQSREENQEKQRLTLEVEVHMCTVHRSKTDMRNQSMKTEQRETEKKFSDYRRELQELRVKLDDSVQSIVAKETELEEKRRALEVNLIHERRQLLFS